VGGDLDLLRLDAETYRLRETSLLRTRGFRADAVDEPEIVSLALDLARPPLDDVRVRRAVDRALDRGAMVQVLGAGEPATGKFPSFMPFATREPRPESLDEASALLDAAGWRRAGSGARQRDGRALELTLTAYPQRPDFLTLLPLVRAQLERAGFRVRTETTEQITPQLQAKRFDIAFWAMHTAPGGDGAFVMEQYLRSSAPLNFMSYASPALDAVLDRLRETEDAEARAALLRAAQAPLFADAPIAFLLTPVWHFGVSRRLASYEPYPSDYYVLNAEV
jgi:peptide/nickel transport system substrate-binding protein